MIFLTELWHKKSKKYNHNFQTKLRRKTMPYGKGTYGSKVGRPPKKKAMTTAKKKPMKKPKKR